MPKRKKEQTEATPSSPPSIASTPSRELPSRRVKTESQQKKEEEKRKTVEEKKTLLSSPTKRTPRKASVSQIRFPEDKPKESLRLNVDGHPILLLTRVQLPCPLQKVTEFHPFRDWLQQLEASLNYHHTLSYSSKSPTNSHGDVTRGIKIVLNGSEFFLKKIDVQVVDMAGSRILFTKMKLVFSKFNPLDKGQQNHQSSKKEDQMEVDSKEQKKNDEEKKGEKQDDNPQDNKEGEQLNEESGGVGNDTKGEETKNAQEEKPKETVEEEEEDEDEEIVERVVFLRGGAVAILVLLYCENEPYTVLTIQPRIPAGHFNLPELPAGMLDGSGQFSGVAAKELEEETGIKINENDLIDLSSLAHAGGAVKHRGVYPSPSNCDEFLRLFAYKTQITKEKLQELEGKLSGLRDHGELITLKVIPLKDLWLEAPDAKALSALCLLRNLEERDGPFPILPH